MSTIENSEEIDELVSLRSLLPRDTDEMIEDEAVGDLFPLHPMDAPGVDYPGPDYAAMALAMLGDPPEKPVKRRLNGLVGDERREAAVDNDKDQASYEEEINVYSERYKKEIEYLYLRTLYDPDFQITVKLKGRRVTTPTLPGTFRSFTNKEGGTSRISGWGPRRTRVMVIGQCPGNEELTQLENFIGPTSQPLVRAMSELGLDTEESSLWYWTNAIKHPQLDPSSKGFAASQVRNMDPILSLEMRLVQPDFILCLGKNATKSVLGPKSSVDKMFGRTVDLQIPIHDTGQPAEYHQARVMAILHPASVSYHPEVYTDLVIGLRSFRDLVRGDRSGDLETDIHHVNIYSARHLRKVVDMVLARSTGTDVIAVDAEWHGDRPGDPNSYLRSIQFSAKAKEAFTVVLRRQGGMMAFSPSPAAALVELKRLMKSTPDRQVRIGGHYFSADYPWLAHFGLRLGPEYTVAETPELTRTTGGWDTYKMVHAIAEQIEGGLKLENLAARFCGIPRYDADLQDWKDRYCREHKLKDKELGGYGFCPDEVLHSSFIALKPNYSAYDADACRRLFDVCNGTWGVPGVEDKPGLLDSDRYGNDCRSAFWCAHGATPAILEMEAKGLGLSRERGDEVTDAFIKAHDKLLASFRTRIHWTDQFTQQRDRKGNLILDYKGQPVMVQIANGFNPNSAPQCRELLFGEELNGAIDKVTGLCKPQRPHGATCLGLTPVLSSGDRPEAWEKVVDRGEVGVFWPSTNRESLGILSQEKSEAGKTVKMLRDLRFLAQALKGTLRRPWLDADGIPAFARSAATDEEIEGEQRIYDGGLMRYMGRDNRVRTHFGLVETGRWSSWGPNLHNLSCDAMTEFLTTRGWVPAPELRKEDQVAQYWPDTRAVDFVKPDALISRRHVGEMVHLKTKEQIDLLVTPDHRCLLRRKRSGKWFETTADTFVADSYHLHAGHFAGGAKKLTPAWVSWLCAVQADGHYGPSDSIQFGLSKPRKLERLRATLQTIGIQYTERQLSKNRADTRFIYISRVENPELVAATKAILGSEKQLGPWLLDYDRATLNLFVDELFYWDGLFTRKTSYSSSDKPNVDWAQALFALSGIRARMWSWKPENPSSRLHWQVSIPAGHTDCSMTTNFTDIRIPWDDNVYCVTVPSQFIIVRRDGKVSITGNSKRREEDYARMLGKYDYDKKADLWEPKGDYLADFGTPLYRFPIRSILESKPGYVWVEADYKMAEMAVIGWLANDPTMIEHVQRNTLPEDDPNYLDLHSLTAINAFGLDTPDNRAIVEAKGLKWGATKSVLKAINNVSLRVAAKNVNFGVPYGRSADAIARQCREEGADVSVEDAQRLIDAYKQTNYPMIARFLETASDRVIEPGWLVTPFGRYRRFESSNDESIVAEMQRAAMNFKIQSTVADAISVACRNLYRLRHQQGDITRKDRWFDFNLQIHDALLFEVPIPALEWFLEEILEEGMSKSVDIWPTDFDGNRRPEFTEPYHLALDFEVARHWGLPLERDWAIAQGIPEFSRSGERLIPKPAPAPPTTQQRLLP